MTMITAYVYHDMEILAHALYNHAEFVNNMASNFVPLPTGNIKI